MLTTIQDVPNTAEAAFQPPGTLADAVNAHLERGHAYTAKGELHLAIAEYGRSLNCTLTLTPQTPGNYKDISERNPDASTARSRAAVTLYWFFKTGGDPARLPPDVHPSVADEIRRVRLPKGYLVTADSEYVLATFPDTDKGQREALAFADNLAGDPTERHGYDGCFLADAIDFETVVFGYDGATVTEVGRFPARVEDDEANPSDQLMG